MGRRMTAGGAEGRLLSFEAALEAILSRVRPSPVIELPLRQARGLALAETVRADRDLPPFHRATMDGYAVRARDLAGGSAVLRVVEEIAAGRGSARRLRRGEAAAIMTGAPLPPGADAVVMLERSGPPADGAVRLRGPARSWQFVARRGENVRRGRPVVERGRAIGPVEVGLLASVGRCRARVHEPPAVAVLSSGEEIVPPGRTPSPVQIRDANGSVAEAFLARCGVRRIVRLGIARDREADLRGKLARALRADVAVISGGVSKGRYDLVHPVLASLGVRIEVHGVAAKPGKPLLFGVGPGGGLVFGLPGNPVSVLVGLHEFVRPALRRRLGLEPAVEPTLPATLTRRVTHEPGRLEFRLARLRPAGTGLAATPVAGRSSGDLVAAGRANGTIRIPARARRLAAGRRVQVRFLL